MPALLPPFSGPRNVGTATSRQRHITPNVWQMPSSTPSGCASALATSPAVVWLVASDEQAQGQVTDRCLNLVAINTALVGKKPFGGTPTAPACTRPAMRGRS